STGDLSLSSTSTYLVDLDLDAHGVDKTQVTGAVSLGSATLQFVLLSATPPATPPTTYVIIDNNTSIDPVVGVFDGVVENTPYIFDGGIVYSVNYHGGDGNDVAITFSSVPEPGSIVMLGALCMLAFSRRGAMPRGPRPRSRLSRTA
ncbi:MAG TPA: PEP-CTERM sorting domain-containing protein, partial [Tepidisphaeraceae bacterium]|nr:PEP-CTERM sorting domain-containing protein [Tepidisphaeraceae bacterium]